MSLLPVAEVWTLCLVGTWGEWVAIQQYLQGCQKVLVFKQGPYS